MLLVVIAANIMTGSCSTARVVSLPMSERERHELKEVRLREMRTRKSREGKQTQITPSRKLCIQSPIRFK